MRTRLPVILSVVLVSAALVLVASLPTVAHGRLLPEGCGLRAFVGESAAEPGATIGSGGERLIFVENVGQFQPQVRFQVTSGTGTVFLTEAGVWYSLLKPEQGASAPEGSRRTSLESSQGLNVRMNFVGANPRPVVRGFDRLPTAVSYFRGRDQADWRTNVPAWGGVRYEDLYPGVDLEFTSDNGFLVQRVVARPGADPSVVRLLLEGPEKLTVAQGLGLKGPAGYLPADISAAFHRLLGECQSDLISGQHLLVSSTAGEFLLPLLTVEGHTPEGEPTIEKVGAATFEVSNPYTLPPGSDVSLGSGGQYDVYGLEYSTFLGGGGYEAGTDIAVDSSGATYVTGATTSSDFPSTTGVFDPEQNGGTCGSGSYTYTCPDVFVAKFNADGSLAYSTFVGGEGPDTGISLALNGSGQVHVTGSTTSPDFPTEGAYDDTCGTDGNCNSDGENDYSDAFVVKLNAGGTDLTYSTFLGGSAQDSGAGVEVDDLGAAYVTGLTHSSDFTTTVGALQPVFSGGTCGQEPDTYPCSDAFVVKLNAGGTNLVYSSFLGADNSDSGAGIAVDTSGSVYLTGATASSTFTTTVGAFQQTFGGGTCGDEPNTYPCSDAFLTKISAGGSAAAYSTFLGGSGSDSGSDIAVDTSGDAYLTGSTGSSDFPTTGGAFDTTHNGGSDAFVAKLSPVGGGGSDLLYGSFFGGSAGETAASIALDASGASYVTGGTTSSGLPTTPGALDSSYHGGTCGVPPFYTWPCTDAFVATLSADGSSLEYGTYLAGAYDDAGVGIAVDASGGIYLTGGTSSEDFPTTGGALQPAFAGAFDSFFTKLIPLTKHSYVPLVLRNYP